VKTLTTILNHNLPEYTDCLYESLYPYRSNLYDLTVLDNGSSSEGKSKYTTFELEKNVYFGGGFNAAMQYVLSSNEYDSLLFMNNDLTICGYNFVKVLRDEMFNNRFDLLSGCFFNVGLKQDCHWKTMHNWGSNKTREVSFIDFQMPLISRRLLEEVKEIDSDLIYGWGIDNYFALICKKMGWKIGVIDRLCAIHYNSLTVKNKKSDLDIITYCKNAETGQYNFFTKNNLMLEFNQIRKDSENYIYNE
jgi:GT2 family glycosyltransferase